MAWRNIWRNPTRSWVVIGAIAIGIWAALFMSGFATGMVRSYVQNAIANIVSHIQIHHPEYDKDFEVNYFIPNAEEVIRRLEADSAVEAYSARTLVNGMIASSKTARGVQVKAVDPQQEAAISKLDEKIVEGEYFGDRRNQLLMGKKLAGKLQVKERSKVVLTFQDFEGEITAAAFRIAGIFETGNDPFDESHLFIERADLNRLLGTPPASAGRLSDESEAPAPLLTAGEMEDGPAIHEIAVLLKDQREVREETDELEGEFPALKVQTYREISPDLELYEGQIETISIIYLTVIMLALIFGIINTMLMAVLERIRELGMLMAIGMNKVKVFFMIVLETIMLVAVGTPLGLLLGALTLTYFGSRGIDLSAFSDTMKMYGMSEVVYLQVEPVVYWQVGVAVAITAVLASIYPASKAIRLRPVEAIRKL